MPSLASAAAAYEPAGPPPIMRTCVSYIMIRKAARCSSGRAAPWGYRSGRHGGQEGNDGGWVRAQRRSYRTWLWAKERKTRKGRAISRNRKTTCRAGRGVRVRALRTVSVVQTRSLAFASASSAQAHSKLAPRRSKRFNRSHSWCRLLTMLTSETRTVPQRAIVPECRKERSSYF